MTQPLNFTPKAIADLMALATAPTGAPGCKLGAAFLVKLLRRAEVFVLPDGGELLDRSRIRPEVPGLTYRPPFPVVALEYTSSDERWLDPATQARSPKRIALAWEWDGLTPGGLVRGVGPEPGSGVAVASICYFDNYQMWMPIAAAAFVSYDAPYAVMPPSAAQQAMLQQRRVNPAQVNTPRLAACEMLALLPEALLGLRAELGAQGTTDALMSDLMDEMNSYVDLCLALACNNVGTQHHSAPDRLNRQRIKAGKPPLKDFHVLDIAGHGDGEGFGGTARGVRPHLRRGHIRRLGPERITWVNAAMVRGRRPGFVDKQYAPRSVQ